MKIFLDTADHWAIKDYFDTGLIETVYEVTQFYVREDF